MAVVIVRQNNLYGALITTPHYKHNYWSSDGFMSEQEIIDTLLAHGMHQADIGGLLDELDQDPRKFCAVLP